MSQRKLNLCMLHISHQREICIWSMHVYVIILLTCTAHTRKTFRTDHDNPCTRCVAVSNNNILEAWLSRMHLHWARSGHSEKVRLLQVKKLRWTRTDTYNTTQRWKKVALLACTLPAVYLTVNGSFIAEASIPTIQATQTSCLGNACSQGQLWAVCARLLRGGDDCEYANERHNQKNHWMLTWN
jgi:hypothetical protein